MQTKDTDLIDRLTAGKLNLDPIRDDVFRRVVPAFPIAPWTTIVAIDRTGRGKLATGSITTRPKVGSIVTAGCRAELTSVLEGVVG